MLKVVPKAWSYAFKVMDGTESVAEAVNLSFWRDKSELRIQGHIREVDAGSTEAEPIYLDGFGSHLDHDEVVNPRGNFLRRRARDVPVGSIAHAHTR